jgi:Cu2+-exporting ATPase
LPAGLADQTRAWGERGQTVVYLVEQRRVLAALAQADVGIAIGAGTDVAIESAGLILATSDPRAVVGIIRLSQAAYRKSLQNLSWAVGYNVIALPLAADVLAGVGIVMPAWVGGVLMSASTSIVAINAQTLRGLRP